MNIYKIMIYIIYLKQETREFRFNFPTLEFFTHLFLFLFVDVQNNQNFERPITFKFLTAIGHKQTDKPNKHRRH